MSHRSHLAAVLAAILIFFSVAHGIRLPYNLPDGVYEFTWIPTIKGELASWTYFDVPGSGTEITAVEDRTDFKYVASVNGYGCRDYDFRVAKLENRTGIKLYDFMDASRAMDRLANWCELYTPLKKDGLLVAIHNDMLFYVCNWDTMHKEKDKQQFCTRRELSSANSIMDRECGEWKLAEINRGEKSFGRSHRYSNICRGKEAYGH